MREFSLSFLAPLDAVNRAVFLWGYAPWQEGAEGTAEYQLPLLEVKCITPGRRTDRARRGKSSHTRPPGSAQHPHQPFHCIAWVQSLWQVVPLNWWFLVLYLISQPFFFFSFSFFNVCVCICVFHLVDSRLWQGVDKVTTPGISSSQMAAHSNCILTPTITVNNMFNLRFVLWHSVGVLMEWHSTLHERCSACASFCKAGQEGCCHSSLCCEDTGGKIASMEIRERTLS